MTPYVSSAVTWLISQTRDSSKFPLITEENINFGFTYNLLGLKPYGIVLSIVGIIINLMLLYPYFPNFTNCSKIMACLIVNLLLWIFVITQQLVISAGRKYARALLSACDSNLWD